MKIRSTLSDVHQGDIFQTAMEKCSSDTLLLSLAINTDGVKIFNSNQYSLWPILLYQNFLPPSIRYRSENILLVGVWYGKSSEIDFLSYFEPLYKEMNELKNGFAVKCGDDRRELIAIPAVTHCILDLPARAKILNMMNFNSYYSCSYCLSKGTAVKNIRGTTSTVRHLFCEPPAEPRSETTTCDIMQRIEENHCLFGIKGISPLVAFEHFNIVHSTGIDYLHAVLLGLVKKFRELWCNSKYCKTDHCLNKTKQGVLNKRFSQIKPPAIITRRPKCFEKADKGVEFRTLLLYYLPISLQGLLKKKYLDNFNWLSSSIYKLLKRNISEEDLRTCESHLRGFAQSFEQLYGEENVTHNVHLMLHIVSSIRNLGPLWAQSTFGFESYNGVLSSSLNGSTKVLSQIVNKYLLRQALPSKATQDETKTTSVVGNGTLIKLSSIEKLAVTSFLCKSGDSLVIFKRAAVNNTIFTSSSYKKAERSVDYFIEFSTKSIGEAQFFFKFKKEIYVLIKEYAQTDKILEHILQIKTKNILSVKNINEISQKLFYLDISITNTKNREFISFIPNYFDL